MHLRQLFAADPERGKRHDGRGGGHLLDYSKNRITDETLGCCCNSPRNAACAARIDAMFRGDKINITENRAVLHVALRAPRGASIIVDGQNVVPEVHAVLDQMADFCQSCPQRRMEGPHRQAAFATSSTSASAAPIWGR